MTPELFGYVFGGLGALTAGILGYLGIRFTARSARVATVDNDATEWERRYRFNAERHLIWDIKIMGRLQQVEQQVGITEPFEEPPPLFPEPSHDEGHHRWENDHHA